MWPAVPACALLPLRKTVSWEGRKEEGGDGVVKPLFCLGEEKLMPKQSERTAEEGRDPTPFKVAIEELPSKLEPLAGCCRQARANAATAAARMALSGGLWRQPSPRRWRCRALSSSPRPGGREPFSLGKLRGIVTRQRSNWLREGETEGAFSFSPPLFS